AESRRNRHSAAPKRSHPGCSGEEPSRRGTIVGLLSIPFAYFFLVVATLAWFARRRPLVRNALLLVASYAFYATWHVRVAGWLLVVSVLDWSLAEAMARLPGPRVRRALVTAGVVAHRGLVALAQD